VHPGGNITGLAGSSDDSSPKQLELLTTIVPNVSRVGLLGNPDTETYSSVLKNAQIAELALANRLATIFALREYAEAGGLMSYGENVADFFRRAASFVDKIFKGASPGDLPIEQPTKFHLVINRKTADALGVTIPPQLYIFADEVIE
jgi:ABC-type uncharacterized transport system substrate-binding protein